MKIEIFDPAMCCSTGFCGPSVDPELTRIARDLDWLKKSGVAVVRYNLGQEPQAFVENPGIASLLEKQGPDVLPVTVVDGVVVKTERYPSKNELESWLNDNPPAEQLSESIRELIAIGAAIAANCESCFRYHYHRALKLGVIKEQMIEAVEIGEAVKNASGQSILGLAERYLVGTKKAGGCCGGDDDGGCC